MAGTQFLWVPSEVAGPEDCRRAGSGLPRPPSSPFILRSEGEKNPSLAFESRDLERGRLPVLSLPLRWAEKDELGRNKCVFKKYLRDCDVRELFAKKGL